MGCCLSLSTTDDRRRQSDGGAPPEEEEEETVKEVLLETPIPPKSATAVEKIKQNNKELKVEEVESTAVIKTDLTPQNQNEVKEVIVSEVVSETFSNSPEKNAGEVNQRLNWRKPQVHGGVRRRAPASAEKIGQVAPLRQRRNVEAVNGCRRDAGESSGRLTRSPGKRDDLRIASEAVVKMGEIGGAIKADNDVVMREEEGETLENPVVSLECFIFL